MLTEENLLKLALNIATKTHNGQTDKSGEPYIEHPIRVSKRCKSEDARIVALLHDTIEDTDVTADYLLKKGFPSYLVDAVLAVTKLKDEDYMQYIQRASQNKISKEVKIADLQDNMDITRLNYPMTQIDFDRLNKYLKAYKKLTNNI
ncbi:MAG: HD domain-containing protein [Paludibacteraceae bacterium]|jgi:(p)ppGpp synthase/HD superfamily hydrolase|nr:HD domain-containing protein [Paludibacteraceae bacterium]HOI25946.1 HD domain-containing protein [Paludibacteraceae bacterium]HOU67823.1 HD domain-containing protein [Paludibacteraceae bacterium]HQF49773.1 HD domain-containing protein [Paludibacteraceae bacterium]